MDEIKKKPKNTLHPWMKMKKRRKSAFPRGGKSKIGKKWVSPAGENEITTRTNFPP